MNELQKFILNNPKNFKELLEEKPYCLKIQEDDNFVLFKYNQIKSDFSNPVVQISRGIILDKSDWSIACHPFHKFFNYMEENAADIDWESAQVFEKIDGSLIKYFFNKYTNSWQFATNGTIDAGNAKLLTLEGNEISFLELIYDTLWKMNISQNIMDGMLIKEYSYIFEITTPQNKIVIPYENYILTHLATIHNETGNEIELMIGFPKPKVYPITTLDECVKIAETLPFTEEGYVVKDKFNNRIKIKGLKYLAVHRLKGESVFTDRRVLDIIRLNEQAEVLSYYPEYKPLFDKIEEKYKNLLEALTRDLIKALSRLDNDRKTFAMWATKQKMPSVLFAFYDDKIITADEGIKELTTDKLLRYL